MRFKINVELTEGDSFPIDYRRKILKLFKTGLSKYDEIFEDFFSSTKQKKYAWSVYFPQVKFGKDEIWFLGDEKKFIINFSVLENLDSINVYNAFTKIKFKEINILENTKVKITNISILPTKFIQDTVLTAKTMSPIVCKDHNRETMQDTYYIGSDEKFSEIIKRNLYLKMEKELGEYVKTDIENLKIDTSQMKKAIIKFYGKVIDTSVGVIKLEGKSYILDYVYNAGLGSITGSGFGLLEKV